ncbi:MAG TPA: GNAT family N-acetyltransferase [Bacteroidales bacterium]|nr:GNAT family N-acetyltransferase [Bacteroidales bacterium]
MNIKYQLSTNVTLDYAFANLAYMTFPDIRKKAVSHNYKNPLLGVVARDEQKVAGLLLAEFDKKHIVSEIITLYVKPEYRKTGIGSTLLKHAQKALFSSGYKELHIVYWSNWKYSGTVVNLLDKLGWEKPENLMKIYKTNRKKQEKIKWPASLELPAGYEIFFWKDLTLEERRQLKESQQQTPWIDPGFDPFKNERHIETLNSIGLKYQGNIIGWIITYRNQPDSVEYNNLFIHPEYRAGLTVPVYLLKESIGLQLKSGPENFIWIIGEGNTGMHIFAARYLNQLIEEEINVFRRMKLDIDDQ